MATRAFEEMLMAIALIDSVITYIDEALDIDDLENLADFIHAKIADENMADWQLTEILRQLHTDLMEELNTEKNRVRQIRLKASITHFEADFGEYLIELETGSLPFRSR